MKMVDNFTLRVMKNLYKYLDEFENLLIKREDLLKQLEAIDEKLENLRGISNGLIGFLKEMDYQIDRIEHINSSFKEIERIKLQLEKAYLELDEDIEKIRGDYDE